MSLFVCKWYEDSSPTFVDDIKEFDHYAYRVHDKDVNDDGTLVKTHFHGCIYCYGPLSLKGLLKRFPSVHFEVMRGSRKDGYDYLTHKNHPNKYQYDTDGIITDKAEFWQDTVKKGGKRDDWVEDVVLMAFENRGRLTYDQMSQCLKEYGRDFVFNYKKVIEFSEVLYKTNVNETHDKLTDEQYSRLLRRRKFKVNKEVFYNALRLQVRVGRTPRKRI